MSKALTSAIDTCRALVGPRRLHAADGLHQPRLFDDDAPLSDEVLADVHAQLSALLACLLCERAAECLGDTGRCLDLFDAHVPEIGIPLRPLLEADESRGPVGEYVEAFARPNAGNGSRSHTDAITTAAYFGERFLARYDSDRRLRHGVFYTPDQVVSYLVSSAVASFEACRSEATAEDRLRRSPRFVDPACGHGVFLDRMIRQAAVRRPWGEDRRMELPRGHELLPASVASANLLLRLRLAHLDSPLRDTNLVAWSNPLAAPDDHLVAEGAARPFPVIVGNPPYSNFGRRNRFPWILKLLGGYKPGTSERKLNLNDDFIKFMRWGQYHIDRAGAGVLALITSNTYLTGLTHRAMRASLLRSFDTVHVLDLRGEHRAGGLEDAHDESAERTDDDGEVETTWSSDGGPDRNVFDIRQGVAITVCVKSTDAASCRLLHQRLLGTREHKLRRVGESDVTSTPWNRIRVASPDYFFVPSPRPRHDRADHADRDADATWTLDRVFRQYASGVQTKRDELFVDRHRERLEERMRRFVRDPVELLGSGPADERLAASASAARFDSRHVRPYMVAPLDVRWVYYDPALLGRARLATMRHLLPGRGGLVFMRQSTNEGPYDHFLAVDCLVSDRVFYSRRGAPYLAPFFLCADEAAPANLAPPFLEHLSRRLGESIDGSDVRAAWNVFGYLYALFHGTEYRRRHDHRLRRGFPPVDLPRDASEFRSLANLGRRLMDAHRLRASAEAAAPPIEEERIRRLALSEDPGDLLDPEDRRVRIGGYPVLARWLKQRRDQELTPPEIAHFRRMLGALRISRELVDRIDRAAHDAGSLSDRRD